MDELKLGKYRHFKGQEYEVLGIVRHSETLEEHILYRALYGNFDLWIRPKNMFFEKVLQNGIEKPRFEYLGPSSSSLLRE